MNGAVDMMKNGVKLFYTVCILSSNQEIITKFKENSI